MSKHKQDVDMKLLDYPKKQLVKEAQIIPPIVPVYA